jgi:ribonuclease-3 family protein
MMPIPGNIDLALEPEAMSPLALAYVGDAVYELYVRLLLVAQGSNKMKDLHRQAISYVKAGTQAAFLKELEPMLTKEELDVVRWGRNAKSGHVPKSADVV